MCYLYAKILSQGIYGWLLDGYDFVLVFSAYHFDIYIIKMIG